MSKECLFCGREVEEKKSYCSSCKRDFNAARAFSPSIAALLVRLGQRTDWRIDTMGANVRQGGRSTSI